MDYLLVLFDIWALAFLLTLRKTVKGILDVGGFTSSPKVYTIGQLRPPVRAMKWIVTGALRQTIEFLATFCLHPNKSRCCKCIHSRFPSAFSLKIPDFVIVAELYVLKLIRPVHGIIVSSTFGRGNTP